MSEFDTLDEYKADIKSKLEKAAADEASTNLDNALVDAVISKMTAEVPQVMYQRRIDDIVREWSARNRIRVEDYLKYTGATMDQFRANFTEVAKRQVDLRLALEKIAELENIISRRNTLTWLSSTRWTLRRSRLLFRLRL